MDVGVARVIIAGDYSRLGADFAAAQGIAASGSKNIASSVNSAFQASSLLVDQFGRSIQASSAAVTAALPPVLNLEGGVQRLIIAQALLQQQMDQTASAAGHEVTQMQAVSGALRTFEGNGGIRAAERFLTLIPGLGAALQYAFPVVGAIALGSAIYRAVGHSEELKTALDELKRSAEAADSAYARMATSIDSTNVSIHTLQFGAAAGKKLEVALDTQQLQQDFEKVKSIYKQVADLQAEYARSEDGFHPFVSRNTIAEHKAQIEALQNEADKLLAEGTAKENAHRLKVAEAEQAAAQQAGSLAAATVEAKISALNREAAMGRLVVDAQVAATHAVRTAEIDAMHDRETAAVASAAEEVRLAQQKERLITEALEQELPKRIALMRSRGAAEAAGKSAPEQAAIGIRTGSQVADAEADAAQKAYEASNAVAEAQRRLGDAQAAQTRKVALDGIKQWETFFDVITTGYDRAQAAASRAVDRQIEGQTRVAEIEAKGTGDVARIGFERQKLEQERQYGLEVGHTLSQQIEYMQSLASLESQARGAKIDGLRNELDAADAIADEVEKKTKVAEIQRQINQLVAEGANATYAANTKILEAKHRGSLAGQLGADAERIAPSVGQAAAKGIIDGKGIGKDIRESLTGIGKQMLGDVFTKAIEEMVIAITGNTIATNLNTIWTELQAIIPHPFGFASGGRPSPGIPYIVGENGPELRVDDGPGTIIPSGSFTLPGAGGGSTGFTPSGAGNVANASRNAGGASFSFGDVHLHGVQNTRQMMREISDIARASSTRHSPYF